MTPRLIVALAARLVPTALRAEWREEWLAELWHLRKSGASDRQLITFAAGAFRHAWAERSRRHAPSPGDARPHWTTGAWPISSTAFAPSAAASTFVLTGSRLAAAEIREAVTRVDGRLPLPVIESLDDRLGARLVADRFLVNLMMTFACVTMAITAMGVYGVVSLVVRSRRRDLGIRLALGAAPGRVVRQVTRDGFLPVAMGLVIGLAGASQASTILASRLHGTSPTDPTAFAAVAIVLLVTGALASWLPARRVAKIDAVEVFRNE